MTQNEIKFKPKAAQEDERGTIVNFLKVTEDGQGFKIPNVPEGVPDDVFVEVAYISFKNSGDVRANHYHPDVSQFVYCVAGSYESTSVKLKMNETGEAQKDGEEQKIQVKAGDLVYTPPMIAHAMKTTEPNTVIININPRPRVKEQYYGGDRPHTMPFKLVE
jgi:oxalate decarboxylase/phosphoglucose isomerase-like protein (cupin superfamily)